MAEQAAGPDRARFCRFVALCRSSGPGRSASAFEEGGWRVEVIVRRLLEAARAKCGAPPQAVFVKSAKVIRQALTAADDLSPASRRALADETNELTPAVERYYDVLVRLVCGGAWEPLMEGQGNFGCVCVGHPENPPAHPWYTECRITPHGIQYLADTAPRRGRNRRST
jgi:hypothetical protein